jgi:AbrB family looped-hinge helix DNA binding protein
MKTIEIRSLGPKNQVTIPAEMLKQLKIKPGDMLKISICKGAIMIKPVAIFEKDEILCEEDLARIEKLSAKQIKCGQYVEIPCCDASDCLRKRIKK